MQYSAIASDFDGTLAGEDWIISPTVTHAIKKWLEKGNHFSMSTGKQYKHIQHECNRLGLSDPQIVRGGAEIIDPKTEKILYAEYIDSKNLRKLTEILLKSTIPFTAEQGNTLYTLTGKPMTEVPNVEHKRINDMPSEDIAKIVLWTDNVDENFVADFVKNELAPHLSSVEIVKSYTPFSKTWQITSQKATKYTAVLELARLLSIEPNQIVGIGDSYNDYPLLSACGYKVAMENAPEELKKIADFIAPSYQDNGVALIINKLLQN